MSSVLFINIKPLPSIKDSCNFPSLHMTHKRRILSKCGVNLSTYFGYGIPETYFGGLFRDYLERQLEVYLNYEIFKCYLMGYIEPT
jgi:hypothetical protein